MFVFFFTFSDLRDFSDFSPIKSHYLFYWFIDRLRIFLLKLLDLAFVFIFKWLFNSTNVLIFSFDIYKLRFPQLRQKTEKFVLRPNFFVFVFRFNFSKTISCLITYWLCPCLPRMLKSMRKYRWLFVILHEIFNFFFNFIMYLTSSDYTKRFLP